MFRFGGSRFGFIWVCEGRKLDYMFSLWGWLFSSSMVIVVLFWWVVVSSILWLLKW